MTEQPARGYDLEFFRSYRAAPPEAAPPAGLVGLPPVTWDGVDVNPGNVDAQLTAVIENVTGWYDTPPLTGHNADRQPLGDGAAWGLKTLGAREVTLTGAVIGPRRALEVYRDVLAGLAALRSPVELAIGDPVTGRVLAAFVRGDSGSFRHAFIAGAQGFRWEATVTAADPLLYERDWRQATLTNLTTGESGWRYDQAAGYEPAALLITPTASWGGAQSEPVTVSDGDEVSLRSVLVPRAALPGGAHAALVIDGTTVIHGPRTGPLEAGVTVDLPEVRWTADRNVTVAERVIVGDERPGAQPGPLTWPVTIAPLAAAPITFRAAGSSTTSWNPQMTMPPGIQAGDTVLCFGTVASAQGTPASLTLTSSQGGVSPQLVASNPVPGEPSRCGFWRWTAPAGHSGTTLTMGANVTADWNGLSVVVYAGADPGNPVEGYTWADSGGTRVSTFTSPVRQTVADGCWGIYHAGQGGTSGAYFTGTPPNLRTADPGNSYALVADTGGPVAAGATIGGGVWTDSAPAYMWGHTVALRPEQAVTAPLVITSTLPGGQVSVPYSATLTATGGVPPYTWTATGLAPGLSLSGATVSGVPTQAGAFYATVTVTDAAGTSASATLLVNVAIAPSPALLITSTLPGGAQGVPYSAALTASGGTPPLSWAASGLPPGLALAGSTVSGTPTAQGSWNVALTVTDSYTGPGGAISAGAIQPVSIGPPPPPAPEAAPCGLRYAGLLVNGTAANANPSFVAGAAPWTGLNGSGLDWVAAIDPVFVRVYARRYRVPVLPNSVWLDNPGDVPAPAWALFTGDLTEPRLTDGTTSVLLDDLDRQIELTVATATLAVEAGGGMTRAQYLLPGSQPLLIPPGGARWHLYSTGHGSVTIFWRGSWA